MASIAMRFHSFANYSVDKASIATILFSFVGALRTDFAPNFRRQSDSKKRHGGKTAGEDYRIRDHFLRFAVCCHSISSAEVRGSEL